MSKLLIMQIHLPLVTNPDSVRRDSLDRICRLVACEGFSIKQYPSDGGYFDVRFVLNDIPSGWSTFKSAFLEGDIGEEIRKSAIVLSEGDRGWDDYLLLYHYDPAEFREIDDVETYIRSNSQNDE